MVSAPLPGKEPESTWHVRVACSGSPQMDDRRQILLALEREHRSPSSSDCLGDVAIRE
jgi:hypothetical protein